MLPPMNRPGAERCALRGSRVRWLLWLALLAAACAHSIDDVSDCDRVTGEKRLECGACLLQNKADGWLGVYEYRPDNAQGQRCARVK